MAKSRLAQKDTLSVIRWQVFDIKEWEKFTDERLREAPLSLVSIAINSHPPVRISKLGEIDPSKAGELVEINFDFNPARVTIRSHDNDRRIVVELSDGMALALPVIS